MIALLAIVAAPGCRALTLNPGRPPAISPLQAVAIETLVERHNRNAELVQSLEAEPSVREGRTGSGSGRLALVRPRDFKLTVSKPVSGDIVADVGSNDEKFWIWSVNPDDPKTYVGNYNEAGQPPPGLLVQPDWVIEALGLRVISPEEEARLTTEPGDDANTLTLVHSRPNGQGGTTIKKTLVDRQSGLIREHIFYGPDGKTELARAWPTNYRSVPLPEGGTVFLPDNLKIRATPPQDKPIELNISMGLGSTKVNQFDMARRDIFTVPEIPGYAIVDLDDQLAPSEDVRGARFDYETLPTPPAGGGSRPSPERSASGGSSVELRPPVPLGADGQTSLSTDPQPRLGDDLGAPGGIDTIIGARIPRPPGEDGTSPEPVPQMSGLGLGTSTVR